MEKIQNLLKQAEKIEIEAHELIEKEILKILKDQDIDGWYSGSLYTHKNHQPVDCPPQIVELIENFENTFRNFFSPEIVYIKGKDY